MKAWVATGKPGEPLALAEVPDPVPGAGEVLVAVDAYSVNRGEMFFLNGLYGSPAQAGWRPGQDIAGTVLQAAPTGQGRPRAPASSATRKEQDGRNGPWFLSAGWPSCLTTCPARRRRCPWPA
jgi:hypothetical protein